MAEDSGIEHGRVVCGYIVTPDEEAKVMQKPRGDLCDECQAAMLDAMNRKMETKK